MNDLEVYQYLDWIIRYSCLKAGAPEFGIVDHAELIRGIEGSNREIYKLVSDFVNAYEAWFEFSKQMTSIWKTGSPTTSQLEQLICITAHRDQKRNLLAERLKSIQ